MARVGIDARLWGTKHTGIGRYVEELVENLVRIDRQNTYVIFCRRGDFDSITVGKKWKRVVADIPHYSLLEQLFLPFIFWKEKLDLLHVPHFNLPVLYPGRAVVTIHDILWHRVQSSQATNLPRFFFSVKHAGYRMVVQQAVCRAARIIVPSQAIKDDVADKLGVPADKIVVTHEGVTQLKVPRKDLKKVPKNPYLLYVGNLYPHKNVQTLVQAIKQLGGRVSLLIVCGRDVFSERFKKFISLLRIPRSVYMNVDEAGKKEADSRKETPPFQGRRGFIETKGAGKSVKLVGYVPDKELAGLYKNASAFVFPTLSEGFGLPGLEAMAYGTPVVCSNIPVLREVYGDAALYFDPKDPGDIAGKIVMVLTNRRLRRKLILKGRQQVKKYSWRKMAQQTLGVYEEVL